MKLIFTLALFLVFALPVSVRAGQEGIVAVVNQGVVTASDLKDRLNLIAASTGLPPSKELNEKLRPQVLDMLIEELVKTQEADRLKITVDPQEVAQGFEMIAKQNNIPVDVFKKALQQRGIHTSTMEDQIRAQLAWNKIVLKRVRPRVDVSEADIDSELDLLKSHIGETQYRLAEIFLPFSEQSNVTDISNLAKKLSDQLQQTPDAFPKVARQFSQSVGAEKGGMIGWVYGGQMPEEIDSVLPNLVVGKVSAPVKTSSGYYLLLVVEKRQISEETMPSRDDILQQIGNQRLDRAQRRYLMDLMSSVFIEKRV